MYYHLGAYDDSLTYALGAGDLFDVNGHSEYVETIIGKSITVSMSMYWNKGRHCLSISPYFDPVCTVI